jgi:hypothetical protein
MPATIPPVIVDLGKQRSSRIRALKRREGTLMHDVALAVTEVRAKSPELADKELVPVVLIYQRKPRRSKALGMFPFSMMK